MTKHFLVFTKIKELLKKYLSDQIEEYDDGMYLSIADSEIWISSDERELTIGYGLVHKHYDPEYDDLEQAVERFFNLLTCRVRRTDFFKGKFGYKHKLEVELSDGTYDNLGTAMTWLFPFWKRTTEQLSYQNGLLSAEQIEREYIEISKLCTTFAKNS